MARLNKCYKCFNKAFGHLDKAHMADGLRAQVPELRQNINDCMKMLGFSGGPGSSPDQPGHPGTPGGSPGANPGTSAGSPMGGAIDASDHGTGPSGAPTPPTGTPPATPVAGESPGVGEAYDSVPVTPGTSSMKPGKASLKLVGTPDLSNMRRVMRSEKCMTKGFEHLFKHMNEADVHEVTRIQAMQHMLKCGQFYKGLYGACGMQIPGETTAPEPKI